MTAICLNVWAYWNDVRAVLDWHTPIGLPLDAEAFSQFGSPLPIDAGWSDIPSLDTGS